VETVKNLTRWLKLIAWLPAQIKTFKVNK